MGACLAASVGDGEQGSEEGGEGPAQCKACGDKQGEGDGQAGAEGGEGEGDSRAGGGQPEQSAEGANVDHGKGERRRGEGDEKREENGGLAVALTEEGAGGPCDGRGGEEERNETEDPQGEGASGRASERQESTPEGCGIRAVKRCHLGAGEAKSQDANLQEASQCQGDHEPEPGSRESLFLVAHGSGTSTGAVMG